MKIRTWVCLVRFTFVSSRNTEARVGESDEQASDTVSRTFLVMRGREPWCEQCRTYQPQSLMVIVSSVCSRSDNSAQVCLAHSASLSRPHHSSQSSKCRKPKGSYHLSDTAEVERATAKSTQRPASHYANCSGHLVSAVTRTIA